MSPRRSATKRSRSTSPSLLQPSAVTDKAGTTAIVLLALATINQWARALIFYTVDFKTPVSDEAMRLFMNVDVGFDEAQYGVLASIGFAALFSITSLIAGGLVDKADPRSLLAGLGRPKPFNPEMMLWALFVQLVVQHSTTQCNCDRNTILK